MRIVSWNVNGIRACHKKGCFNWFFEERPDILCLQEIKAEESQIPEEIRNPRGYFSYFSSSKKRKGYSGVAVYTTYEPVDVRYEIDGGSELDQEGRSILLYFKDWVLINVYFPNGGGGASRLAFKLRYYETFLKRCLSLQKQGYQLVFCGDVNTAHHPIDLARPKENEKNTGFLPEERAWLDQVQNKGFIDTFRYFYPEKQHAYTYWDMKTFARERNVGWRIDYIFVDKSLKDDLVSAHIHESITGSDHCPISLELKK